MTPYDVPPKMCRGTYVAITKLITRSYKNNIKTDDDISASIFAESLGPFKCYVSYGDGPMGVSAFPEKKRYEGVRFNVIGVMRGWMGVQFPGKRHYVTLEWPHT